MWAGYSRVSRVGDRAERLISPKLQADRVQAYAASHGLRVEMLAPELDVSGGKAERPILSEVIEAIEEGRYEGIVVSQLDRLSRLGISDAIRIIERIESGGGKVIAVAENFDAATPEGEMARNVILSLGHMQLRRYRDHFADAKRSAVERGIWPTPTPPLGYVKDNARQLAPGPDARKVKRAFEMRAAGAPWSELADLLETSVSNAANVIKNRAYLGEVGLGTWRNTEAHPALVPRDLYEAAQIPHPRRPRGKRTSLLAGLIRCAGCRWLLSPGPIDGVYRCSARKTGGRCTEPAIVSMRLADQVVTDAVLAHFHRVSAKAAPRTDALDRAGAELSEAEAELVAYQEVQRVSGLGAEHFLSGLRSRVLAVEGARRRLAAARTEVTLPEAHNLAARWPKLSVEQKRHVLGGALGVVWVVKGRPATIRLVERGYEPPFPRRGDVPVSVRLDGDLPGEVRVLGT